jgi:hypothetical protein
MNRIVKSPCSGFESSLLLQPVSMQQLPTPAVHAAAAAAAAAAFTALQYNISAREIFQSVLPTVKPATAPPECATYDPTARTRVWAYGTDAGGTSTHNWPSYTIEATVGALFSLSEGPGSVSALLHCRSSWSPCK